jgi:MEDS: MEthanogen/methylotroph, DcmR Sensory domain/Putative zinc-finger
MSPLNCERVQQYVSEYIDGTLTPALRVNVEQHLATCEPCARGLESLRNVVGLASDQRLFEPPKGYSQRLYSKLQQAMEEHEPLASDSPVTIPVGITDDYVPLGAHLLYIWSKPEEFARGVRFLYPGLGADEHCIIFGHTEALDRVQSVLRSDGFDPERLQSERKLTVLHRHAANRVTLTEIAFAVQRAMHSGARLVRFLGNLGLERDPLPAGEDDVVELERKAGALISKIPCVIICMYDAKTLSGSMILKGGLEHHELSICNDAVHQNPFNLPGGGHSDDLHIVQ